MRPGGGRPLAHRSTGDLPSRLAQSYHQPLLLAGGCHRSHPTPRQGGGRQVGPQWARPRALCGSPSAWLTQRPSHPGPFPSPRGAGQTPRLPRAEDTFRKQCLPQNKVLGPVPFSPGWPSCPRPLPRTGGRRGTLHVWSAVGWPGEARQVTQDLGPSTPSAAGPCSPGNSALHSAESSLHRVSLRSGGAGATFCKQAFVSYSARTLVPSVSAGRWKAAPTGQPAGQPASATV